MIIKQTTTLVDMPMKKGSAAVVTESRHIRGSIEDISKIKYFIISSCKDNKSLKTNDESQKNFRVIL